MRPVPDCLQRRYQVMDTLVDDLSSGLSNHNGKPEVQDYNGTKLMYRFWDVVKEDPNTDLKGAVQQSMPLNKKDSSLFRPENITCYVCKDDKKSEKKTCSNPLCIRSKNPDAKLAGKACCLRKAQPITTTGTPLTQTLQNMKKAAINAKKTCSQTTELMNLQKQLSDQITQLEKREEAEVKLMKEADEIWNKMEEYYKQKLLESKQRQDDLLQELDEVETSASKWKQSKRKLEEQLRDVERCIQEIRTKHQKKNNDVKAIAAETAKLEEKIESHTREILLKSEAVEAKKKSFDQYIKNLSEERKNLHIAKKHEEKLKKDKIEQGNECVKEATAQLAKLTKVLLKKKLENENLRAEAKALAEEIDLLKITCESCSEKSQIKEQTLISEIDKCDSEIENFKLKCTKCHVSCDTKNLVKYCTECPRCQEESCAFSGNICNEFPISECVCVNIKIRFMNNVFENMQTVLERKVNSIPGKAVATEVLKCLKRSTNGKLDFETRKKLQEFILASVKTNLNLTIIGGAVKTRCEMDPDTYKRLTQCLKQIRTIKPEKIDMGTDSRKAPCRRWGGTNECNCPNGPKECICKAKGLKPSSGTSPCGPPEEDKEDSSELSICPHKDDTPCGPLCSNIPNPDEAKIDKKLWKPSPCSGQHCTFNKNMRAAQCDLGKECNSMNVFGKQTWNNAPRNQTLWDDGYNAYEINNGNLRMKQKQGCQQEWPCETKFKDMLNRSNTNVPVTVKCQNGIKAKFNAEIKETDSGHIFLDVRKLSNVGEIVSQLAEYPVSLINTSSSCKLMIFQNNKQPNAVLKRNSKGEVNVIFKDVDMPHKKESDTLKPQQKLFRVKVKHREAQCPECIIITATPSGNFKFVLDKEFENLQKKVVNNSLGDTNECSANVSRTQSGTFVVDFDKCYNYHQTYHNALLKKTNSGNIKLLVNVPYSKISNKCNIRCCTRFESLYEKLSNFNTFLQKDKPLKQRELGRHLECGLKLNTYIRITIQDQDHFVGELFVRLSKISPGQYSVMFENKAEELFIGHLLTLWLGQLPIQKNREQQLTVFLNQSGEVNNQYGWLKISPNGEILVVVDKISEIVQTSSSGCVGMLYKDKGITTTCHQKIDLGCDCNISKCICDKISLGSIKWYTE